MGTLWAYYRSDEIRIEGETTAYVRTDIADPRLAVHHCPICGATTHWMPLSDPPHERMGINARLLDPHMIDGVEIRKIDGLS